jgi:hypothetical protein
VFFPPGLRVERTTRRGLSKEVVVVRMRKVDTRGGEGKGKESKDDRERERQIDRYNASKRRAPLGGRSRVARGVCTEHSAVR